MCERAGAGEGEHIRGQGEHMRQGDLGDRRAVALCDGGVALVTVAAVAAAQRTERDKGDALGGGPCGEDFEPLAQRLAVGRLAPADPQVHQVQAVDPERLEVRLHGGPEVGGRALCGSLGAEDRTDLGRNHQPAGQGSSDVLLFPPA